MLISEFLRSSESRRRYWARSFAGWPQVARAKPNRAHYSIARLQSLKQQSKLITQNVDRLHQQAGSQGVIDLHGRLDQVECLHCREIFSRARFQQELFFLNQGWGEAIQFAPDGDAEIAEGELEDFQVPACSGCGGPLKPAVVFFGEGVPKDRVDASYHALESADALLVVGSSLAVWSGYRFVRRAVERKIPVLIVNRGSTRADEDATVKVSAECGVILESVVKELGSIQDCSLSSRWSLVE